MNRARHWAAFLLAAGLALTLAGGLAACGGSADGDPPSAEAPPTPPATPELPAAPAETTAPDSSTSTATATPAAPGEPPVPDASTPTDEPAAIASAASEPTAAPVEPPTGDPSAAPDEAEALPLLYDTYDLSGAVAEPGHYVFLADPADPASVVTTYEGLRDGRATALLIHTHDAHGISRADLYDAVRAGDLVEWHRSASCFVRYTVTEVKDDPAGDPPRKLLAVGWMTYAFTGCSGAIASTATASLQWGQLPALGGTSLTAPVVHGMTQIVPEDWSGAIMEPDLRGDPSGPPPFVYTTDLATARTLPYWREPRLPTGWTLEWAEGGPGSLYASVFGYMARYRDDRMNIVTIYGTYVTDALVRPVDASWGDGRGAAETRVVNGRPVVMVYSPPGPNHSRTAGVAAVIYDQPTETAYAIEGASGVGGTSLDTVLTILGSLFESPNQP